MLSLSSSLSLTRTMTSENREEVVRVSANVSSFKLLKILEVFGYPVSLETFLFCYLAFSVNFNNFYFQKKESSKSSITRIFWGCPFSKQKAIRMIMSLNIAIFFIVRENLIFDINTPIWELNTVFEYHSIPPYLGIFKVFPTPRFENDQKRLGLANRE